MNKEVENDIIIIMELISKHYYSKNIYAQKRSLMTLDLLYLCNPTLSHKEVSEKIGKALNSVRAWRVRNYPEVIYSKYFKTHNRYSEYEENLLKQEHLSSHKIASITGRSIYGIKDARKQRMISEDYESYSQYYGRNSKLEITKETIVSNCQRYKMSEIVEIVNSEFNSKELAIEFGRSVKAIDAIKNKYKHLKKSVDLKKI